MTSTPADPAMIDLKAIQSWSTQIAPIPELIAAIEALRARVAELENLVDSMEALLKVENA